SAKLMIRMRHSMWRTPTPALFGMIWLRKGKCERGLGPRLSWLRLSWLRLSWLLGGRGQLADSAARLVAPAATIVIEEIYAAIRGWHAVANSIAPAVINAVGG